MSIHISDTPFQQNPYPVYAALRQQSGIAKVFYDFAGTDVPILTRYEDVALALKDPRFINDQRRLPGAEDWTQRWYMPAALKIFAETMALKDAPDHTRLRGLVHKVFTPSMIDKLSARIEQLTEAALDAMQGKAQVDLVEAFAVPIPLQIITDMLGVPYSDQRKFRRWMGDTVTNFSAKDPLGAIPKMLNAMGMNRYLRALIAERRRAPQDDLTTQLVQAEENGDKLSEAELVAMLFLLLFAGHETTANLISVGTLSLLQHPEQLARLQANPSLLDSAIEEMLRYNSPTQQIAIRYNTEDVTLNGERIPAYSTLILAVAAANRDETVFPNPDAFDIGRSPNKHLAFGLGAHFCLGAPLARLEARIIFKKLLERYPTMRLAIAPEQLEWRGGPSLRGLRALPLHLA